MAIRSRRSANEKQPWKGLDALSGNVESQFVHPLHLGETVVPYRLKEPVLAVVPWDGTRLLGIDDDRLDSYPGLADWWRRAEALWTAHRSSERLSLIERADYRRGLSAQLPTAPHRVVYGASGMYMAAARLSDELAVIEHSLYWAATASIDEARFLTAVLNSETLTSALRPLQARGEHNPRHYDKYVFDVPIPLFDESDDAHNQLVQMASRAEAIAESMELTDRSFEAQRRHVRHQIADSEVGQSIECLVARLIS
jgi:hypothetical protein